MFVARLWSEGSMVRIAKPTDPKRISELKVKINDKRYMSVAVQRIANTLTREIMHMKEERE